MHMDIEARVRRAEELFHEGYNCSQSVVLAFADLTGVDEALLEKISIGLGGGVGRLREVCGAVSGMAMVAGFICDRCGCGDGSAPGGSAGVADSDGSGGAVSAGSLRTDAGARRAEQKKLAYSLVQELAGKFREENGSIVCHDLLNLRVNAAKAARDGKASGVDVVAGAGGVAGSSTGIGVADAVGTAGEAVIGGLAGTSAYSPVPQERNEAYYKARPCQKLVGCSARIIAEYIAKNY